MITKRFDLTTNRKNSLVGTRLNWGNDLQFQINWKIDPKLNWLTSFSYTHFTNGRFSLPATNLNILSVNTGLTINLGRPVAVNHNSFPILNKTLKWIIWTGFWLKQAPNEVGASYGSGILAVNGLLRTGKKLSFGGGLDFMYDRSLLARLPKPQHAFRMGGVMAMEIHIGKMTIPIQQGFYLVNAYKEDLFLYQRIGWRYHLKKNYIIQLSLKNHLLKTDQAELGFGYIF